jgi:hypothetical protein
MPLLQRVLFGSYNMRTTPKLHCLVGCVRIDTGKKWLMKPDHVIFRT